MSRSIVARSKVNSRPLVAGRTTTPSVADPGNPVIPTPPTVAPTLSNISVVGKTTTSATIHWEADQFCSGQVNYGTTAAYGSSSTLQTCCQYNWHEQEITGLTANTTYHYRVRSSNGEAQETVSGDYTFTTDAAPVAGNYPTATSSPTYTALVSATVPTYKGTHACTTYGSVITRVSNANDQRHKYSSLPMWNADSSMLVLGFGSANRAILRTSDWAVLNADQGFANTLNWYNSDPLKAWSRNGTFTGIYRQMTVNPTTGVIDQGSLTTPTALSGTYNYWDPGGGQGCTDDADAYIAGFYRKTNGWQGISVMDMATGTILYERDLYQSGASSSLAIDNCGMSHDGNWVVVVFETAVVGTGTGTGQGMWIYPRDLSTGTRRQVLNRQQHWDWGETEAGSQRFCYWDGNVTSFNPSTGASVVLLGNLNGSTHISGRNHLRPGYVYVGQASSTDTNPGARTVFSLSVDRPGEVEIWCFMHRTQGGDSSYNDQPMPCPNPTGERVVYAGKWEGGTTNYAYVVEMA